MGKHELKNKKDEGKWNWALLAANVLLTMDADLNGRVDAQDVRAVADSFVYDTALPAAQEDET